MSLQGLREARSRPPHGWAGTILDSAETVQDRLRVRLDSFGDGRQFHGPMPFTPGAVLPVAGDRCVVLFDEARQPCIVWWETSEALAFQPSDSDLTAIAALTTTSYGRALLELANAAAARSAIGTDATGAQRPPQGPESNLKVIRGLIDTTGSGTIREGSGFTIARNSTGDVTITFTQAFSDVPTVVATSEGSNFAFHSGNPTVSTARIQLRNAADVAQDQEFHFIAIGPA